MKSEELKARVIALYLPQYHPIPENDKYWGKGFTEWTNVVRAKPLFRGHQQPRVPADLGFYDLRYPEIKMQQADLAREAGIEGFCYWQYWLGNGKMLLHRPFEQVLESGKPDFPFCLGWANHTWSTGTWVKGKRALSKEIIAEQLYPGKEDYINHFNYCLPAFKDKRYITVDGKPFYLIFDPHADVDQINCMMEVWQELAKEHGFPGIHFVATIGGNKPKEIYLNRGFDAVNYRAFDRVEIKKFGSRFSRYIADVLATYLNLPLRKISYKFLNKYWFDEIEKDEACYPTILPNYDRSPRAGTNGTIVYGSTPELFREHVQKAIELVKDKPYEHRIIILKSWNEWGETNYMEPDLLYGSAYLDVLKEEIK